jgi:RHH-type proline utilization regulon transcriptional repressor/proline dehydrogenase/delta 1-pyrroline-5-carboxylate dehydrogenase
MPSATLPALRTDLRAHYLADEEALARRLIEGADIGAEARARAQEKAAAFVKSARADARRSGLIDKFLQEYGLSTAEGVTLMRLAEALLRTPDAATADALIKDKVEAGDWAAHKGKSPFPLVNFSTRALMLTAAWLDDIEAKDPTGKIVKATKGLLDRVGEPVIRAAVGEAMKIMGEHFVLGQTIGEALQRGRAYAQKGYNFSFDMLGEAAHTAADAEKYFDDYARAIDAIASGAGKPRPADNPGISVKLSALHPRYEPAKRERVLKELGGKVRELAIAAKAANIGFNIDAEESWRLDLSLDLIEALMRDPGLADWDGFGVVVQAYQRRASFAIDWLAALARSVGRRIMVRLVKGAYWDGEIKRAQVMGLASYPVFTRKVLTDISYQACARRLFANMDVFYPQFATHNALTAALVREMAGEHKDYELQRLHGMGEALHDSLVREGARSRIYAPVGGHRELLPYLVRRLLENGANSSFVNQLFDPDRSIDDVVADPLAEARSLAVLPSPAIPAPRDLFGGERLAAQGFDASEPDVASLLERAVAPLAGEPLAAAPTLCPARRTEVDVRNPADRGEVVGRAALASAADVEAACLAARDAQRIWAQRSACERSEILRRAAAALEGRAAEFMHLAVREAGKTIPDAVAEVREAVDFLRYYAHEAERRELAGKSRTPLGVVACISPWNFPLAIFLGQISAALAAGNAVIAKPAEQTPLIAAEAVELLHEAGVLKDALILLPGDGPQVGAPLVGHPIVNGVVFTGSTEVAQAINRGLAETGKSEARLIAETGGINAMIVDSTALLEQAVSDAVASAFQSAGQRCSACRVVAVQDDVADRFCEMLAGAMAELSVGDPSRLETDVGPLIDADARRSIEAHVAEMERSARLIARAPSPDPLIPAHAGTQTASPQTPTSEHAAKSPGPGVRRDERAGNADAPMDEGTFLSPVAFEVARLSDVKREVFGPVLHLVRFEGERLLEVVKEINALGYGLTLGLHTRIDEIMHQVASRARVGNVYINRNQIGAVVGVQPFGGEGLSGTGPKAGGPHYLDALTRGPGEGPEGIDIVDHQDAAIEAAFMRAAAALPGWTGAPDRARRLERAAELASGEARTMLAKAAAIAARLAESETLPGPTGESNLLRLKPRGPILCLGPAESIRTQMACALGAGNLVLASATFAEEAAIALAKGGDGAVVGIGLPPRKVYRAALAHMLLCGVAFDGRRALIQQVLASRPGPILPILHSQDDIARYCVERTLTINTTAAGGDVRLLSLPD